MKHNLIKTNNYLLVVSDEEIKKGDFIYETNIGECSMVDDWYLGILKTTTKVEPFVKVIAHLPLNNSPILEGVDLLPPLPQGEDVVKMANECGDEGIITSIRSFVVGYEKAKEKYKYTEDDVENAMLQMAEYIADALISKNLLEPQTEVKAKEIIQSLQQPKFPIAFEVVAFDTGNDELDGKHILDIRKVTDSQGKTEWVGKYIYN